MPKMANILQTLISNPFYWKKSFECWFNFNENWHHADIDLCNRLAPNRRQVITWTNGGLRSLSSHGSLARYVKLRVAHAPEMPGTFYPPLWVSDPDLHHDTCVTHVPWCMSGLLTSDFLWSQWRGKRSRHSRRMRNPQFYVSSKRPMA